MRIPKRYKDWPQIWPEQPLPANDRLLTEIWPYFGWSAPQVPDLIRTLEIELKWLIIPFELEKEIHASDADERTINRAWCEELVGIIDQWCLLLDLDPTDLPKYTKARRQSVWNEDLIRPDTMPNSMLELFISKHSSGDFILRPGSLEQANDELMRWLSLHPSDVDRVHHRTFEAIVAEVMKEGGWYVELTKRTRDWGYDILCLKNDSTGHPIKMIVETKLYDLHRTVGVATVDRLMGVALREHAHRAVLVTNSKFTNPAWQSWEKNVGRDLDLVDRDELLEWLGAWRSTR